ncbi:MAG: portal protein [Smithella sp.]|nr:portal protein [Smithella sp.]
MKVTKGKTLKDGIPEALLSGKGAPDISVKSTTHPLDTPEAQEKLKKLMAWRRQARIAQADNRIEMAIDEDFYDGIQLEDADLQILKNRNQPPLVFNVTKNTVNWILGTERRARIDSRVMPRKKAGSENAKSKTKLMKYTQDVSKGEYEKSKAFEDCVKAGLGWLETGVRKNDDEPIFIRRESWRNMWHDHLGLSMDGSDYRFIIREKWIDLDVAAGMFPDREGRLKTIAEHVNTLYPYLPDDTIITDIASEFDLESSMDALFGDTGSKRERIKFVEMWYRMPANVKLMKMRSDDTPYGVLHNAIYRPEQEDHKYLVRGGYFTLTDARILTVRCAIWAGATLFQDILTPYNHNRLPFTPMFCYRRSRDNMPYGVIRDLRDPQSDLNKRRSKALSLLTANRVIAEKGAVNDKKEAFEEVNRADGWVEVNEGKMDKFKIQEEREVAVAHVEMARDNERFIESVSGITPENKGTIHRDLSGEAIKSIQEQGMTTSGLYFDNMYLALQTEGEIRLSLIEQFYDQEKEYRITGDQHKDEFIKINEQREDGTIANNITEAKGDFIISKQNFKDTIRQSMLSTLTELVTSLAQSMPEVALKLLDMVVGMMDDLPGRDEIVARIRKVNGENAPEEEQTPEEKEQIKQNEQLAAEKQQFAEQMQTALANAELATKQADANAKNAKAMRDTIEAVMKRLETFLTAIQAAGALNIPPEVATAADNLLAEANQIISGNQTATNEGGQ